MLVIYILHHYPVTLLYPLLCTILSPVAVAGISVWPLLDQTSYWFQCHIPKFAKSGKSFVITVHFTSPLNIQGNNYSLKTSVFYWV